MGNWSGSSQDIIPSNILSSIHNEESVKRMLTKKEKEKLMKSIQDGNYEKAIELINLMDDINENMGTYLGSTLINACRFGREDIVKYLISLNADVNKLDINEYSPLMQAVSARNIGVVKLLIDAGADLNYTTPFGYSAFSLAGFNNCDETVELFISSGVNVGSCGGMALFYSAKNNNFNMLKRLIDCGADVNFSFPTTNSTPLYWACKNNNFEIVELLINMGADENKMDTFKKLPVEYTEDEKIKEFIISNSTKYVLK